MTAVAILFAKTSLKMSSSATIVIGILTQTTAVGSAFMTPRIQRRYNLSSMRMLAGCLWGVIALCIYVLIGLVGDMPYGGLKSPAEMYACAVWFGVVSTPAGVVLQTDNLTIDIPTALRTIQCAFAYSICRDHPAGTSKPTHSPAFPS